MECNYPAQISTSEMSVGDHLRSLGLRVEDHELINEETPDWLIDLFLPQPTMNDMVNEWYLTSRKPIPILTIHLSI